MRRAVPLKRGESRLTAHTSLARYTGLSPATRPLTRRPPLRVVPPLSAAGVRTLERGTRDLREHAQRGETFPPPACTLIDLRDSDTTGTLPVRLCQRCGSAENPQRHHRRAKGKGGSGDRAHTHCPCNSATLCGPGGRDCHGWAHAHPAEAMAQGFIVSQSVDFPGLISVMRFAEGPGGASQYPSCDGRWLDWVPGPDRGLAA